ncbi:MAG: cyclic lactone autoinducer peptide [Firmicutes bacterium]|nr:cyclic lactone autoinducer peptide [Bacillota bacterium]
MKKMSIWIFSGLVSLLTFISLVNVAGACSWLFYEPEVPAKLRQ